MTLSSYKKSKVALDGLDPVVYMSRRQQVPGKTEFKMAYKGLLYCFSSKENLALFSRDPSRFLPQFDGNCPYTYAVYGEFVPGWPVHCNVIDDKLYFYSKPFYAKVCRFLPFLLTRAHRRYNTIVSGKAIESAPDETELPS